MAYDAKAIARSGIVAHLIVAALVTGHKFIFRPGLKGSGAAGFVLNRLSRAAR